MNKSEFAAKLHAAKEKKRLEEKEAERKRRYEINDYVGAMYTRYLQQQTSHRRR